MPSLADSKISTQFVDMLTACEQQVDSLSVWEQGFIGKLREGFESREAAADLGLAQWSPTANQWNTLHDLAARCGWTYERRSES